MEQDFNVELNKLRNHEAYQDKCHPLHKRVLAEAEELTKLKIANEQRKRGQA